MGTPSLAGCPALSIMSMYTGSSSTADGTADPRGGAPPYTWGFPLPTGAWVRAGVAARTLRSLLASSPRPWTCSHRGLPASWSSAARSRCRRGGVRSCPSVDVGRRHCACRAGTLAPGASGRVVRTLWWLGAPRPLPGRSGVLFDWSLTAGLCAADRAAVEGFPWPERPRGWAPLRGCSPGLRLAAAVFHLERRRKVMLWSLLRQGPRGALPSAAGSPP